MLHIIVLKLVHSGLITLKLATLLIKQKNSRNARVSL